MTTTLVTYEADEDRIPPLPDDIARIKSPITQGAIYHMSKQWPDIRSMTAAQTRAVLIAAGYDVSLSWVRKWRQRVARAWFDAAISNMPDDDREVRAMAESMLVMSIINALMMTATTNKIEDLSILPAVGTLAMRLFGFDRAGAIDLSGVLPHFIDMVRIGPLGEPIDTDADSDAAQPELSNGDIP